MNVLPRDVQEQIKRQLPKIVKRDFDKKFKLEFEKIKKEMIKEFLNHPVTLEIISGPNGANISGTLGGKSNLFAFIGFDSGSSPIDPIIEILNNMKYRDSGDSNIGREFTINFPTKEDIFLATPMPWATGRSWAKGIESGISGLGNLLNKSNSNSRSGVAIQVDRKVRGGRFKNTAYISALLNKYEKIFKETKILK